MIVLFCSEWRCWQFSRKTCKKNYVLGVSEVAQYVKGPPTKAGWSEFYLRTHVKGQRTRDTVSKQIGQWELARKRCPLTTCATCASWHTVMHRHIHNDKNMSWVGIWDDTILSYWKTWAENNVGPKPSVKSWDGWFWSEVHLHLTFICSLSAVPKMILKTLVYFY